MIEPKIMLFDLEIIPNLQKALNYWPMLNCSWDSSTTLKAEITSICSFGFERFGDNKAKVKNAWAFDSWENDVNDDKEICTFIYEKLKDADALVFQNGDKFDLPYLNTRLEINKLPSLPKIATIDTKKMVKKHYFLLRNSLDHISETFTDEKKMDILNKWKLWIDTHNRKKSAMKLMSDYCKQDIVTLREIFKVVRPKVTNIPNYNLWTPAGAKAVCPMCGSTRLISNGYRSTKTRSYKRLQCQDCGGWSRTDASGNLPRSI